MPPLKETYLQIQERNRREIRNRTNKKLGELAQETERNRQQSGITLQEDEIEDEIEDKIEDKIVDRREVRREDKIEGLSVSCLSVRRVVFLVILSLFVWSVVFRAL